MKKHVPLLRNFSALLLSVCFIACSGGGGGGVGGRTSSTALRVVHAVIDATPVSLFRVVGEEHELLQTARFAQVTEYVEVDKGEIELSVQRSNSAGHQVASFNTELEKDTEYTIFLFGEVQEGGLRSLLIQDTVEQPEEGLANAQVLNAYTGSRSVTVSLGGQTFGPLASGQTSGFLSVPSGELSYVVSASNGGELQRGAFNVSDQGEITLLVAGSADLGVVFVPIFRDLD